MWRKKLLVWLDQASLTAAYCKEKVTGIPVSSGYEMFNLEVLFYIALRIDEVTIKTDLRIILIHLTI